MHQFGIFEYAVRKSKSTRNPCSISSKNKGTENKGDVILLKLRDFAGAFFILGVGLGFATVALICEYIAKRVF